MSHYNCEKISNVYWAASDGFKTGRDPMGIQNSSIATYTILLPGMTNLTGHIRYYSLYCWLLDEYAKLDQLEIEKIHQYNFIRRAELIMAFLMQDKSVNSVIGSDFVLRKKEAFFTEGIIDIAQGADYQSSDRYWAYQSGAFGQYYLGSLIYYNLIAVINNAFYVTNNEGASVCDAFRDSVTEDVRRLYLKRIIEGKLYIDDINTLEAIGLTSIKINSSEWIALNNLLIKSDKHGSKISTFRSQSVYLMLKDLQKGVPFSEFIENRYKSFDIRIKDPNAEFGWFFYYLCEVFHYCIETIFCYLLTMIDNLKNPPIEILLDVSTHETTALLEDHEAIKETVADGDIHSSIIQTFHILKTQIKNNQYNHALVSALSLVDLIYIIYSDNRELFIKFEADNDLARQRGILSTGLEDYVEKHKHQDVRERIETIFRQVLNEHYIVALNRMGNSDYDLRKFLIEDGCTILVEIRYPNLTNPRINSLHNYLKDLYYINDRDELTEIGQNFINNYGK